MVEIMKRDEKLFVDMMMVEELGIALDQETQNPYEAGAVNFSSFMAFGLLPILPFFVFLIGVAMNEGDFDSSGDVIQHGWRNICEWEKPRENVAIWDQCFSASNMMHQNATRPKHMCQNVRQRGSYFCSDHNKEFEKKKNTTTFYQHAHLLVLSFLRDNYPFPQFNVDVLTTDLPLPNFPLVLIIFFLTF